MSALIKNTGDIGWNDIWLVTFLEPIAYNLIKMSHMKVKNEIAKAYIEFAIANGYKKSTWKTWVEHLSRPGSMSHSHMNERFISIITSKEFVNAIAIGIMNYSDTYNMLLWSHIIQKGIEQVIGCLLLAQAKGIYEWNLEDVIKWILPANKK